MIYEVHMGRNMITCNIRFKTKRVICHQVEQDAPLTPQNKARLITKAKADMLRKGRCYHYASPQKQDYNPFLYDWIFYWNDGTRTR